MHMRALALTDVNRPSERLSCNKLKAGLGRQPSEQARSLRSSVGIAVSDVGRQPFEQVSIIRTSVECRVSSANSGFSVSDVNRPSRCDHLPG